jgi:hypothetical protein
MGVRIGAGATPLEATTALSGLHDSHPVPSTPERTGVGLRDSAVRFAT